MNPDLYDAWVNAGIKLQPVGHWVVDNWINLAIAAALGAFAWWSIRRSLRQASRTVDRILDELPERETKPGSNRDDLRTCQHILRATKTQTWKEKPQP